MSRSGTARSRDDRANRLARLAVARLDRLLDAARDERRAGGDERLTEDDGSELVRLADHRLALGGDARCARPRARLARRSPTLRRRRAPARGDARPPARAPNGLGGAPRARQPAASTSGTSCSACATATVELQCLRAGGRCPFLGDRQGVPRAHDEASRGGDQLLVAVRSALASSDSASARARGPFLEPRRRPARSPSRSAPLGRR